MDRQEIEGVIETIRAAGLHKIAVVGKFSNRNPQHMSRACGKSSWTNSRTPRWELVRNWRGQLNFMRRITTSYYALMTRQRWTSFALEIEKAIRERGLDKVPHGYSQGGWREPCPCVMLYNTHVKPSFPVRLPAPWAPKRLPGRIPMQSYLTSAGPPPTFHCCWTDTPICFTRRLHQWKIYPY